MALLQESLVQRFADKSQRGSFMEAGQGLFAVVELLGEERALRAMLADPAIGEGTKTETIKRLFSGKVSDLAVAILTQISTSRWSSDADMVDASEESAATLILMGAEADGNIDRVEEELFRFGRAIDANPPLQMALTDPSASSQQKAGIVDALLDGKAAPETVTLLAHVAGSLRGRRIQSAVVQLSELAAARRGRIIADIRSAVELTDSQQQRLAAVLAKLHGQDVELNIEIDPTVIGGIEVRVGDEVIDGTAATKLEQARRKLAG